MLRWPSTPTTTRPAQPTDSSTHAPRKTRTVRSPPSLTSFCLHAAVGAQPSPAASLQHREGAVTQDSSQLPCCSSILAATLRRLRGQRSAPEGSLLRFEGRLPEQDFPGLWRPLAGEASRKQCQATAQSKVLEASDLNSQAGSASQQLSLAEQCRQRLAARGARRGIAGSLMPAGVAKRAGPGRGKKLGTVAAPAKQPG